MSSANPLSLEESKPCGLGKGYNNQEQTNTSTMHIIEHDVLYDSSNFAREEGMTLDNNNWSG